MRRALLASLLLIATPALAEEVAVVLATQGTADVVRANGVVSAAPRLSLDRNDTLQTGEDGTIIVLLNNSRLVRIDEEVSLKVGQIVLLASPKTSVPVNTQLAELLYPSERDTLRGVEDAERIAGWQSRLQAATAVPAQRADMAKKAVADSFASTLAASEEAAPVEIAEDSGTDEIAKDTPVVAKSSVDYDAVTEEVRTPAQIQAVVEGELRSCVKGWRKAQGLDKGAAVVFDVRVVDGRIARMVGEGGLAAAACMRDRLEGERVEGPFEMTVTLP